MKQLLFIAGFFILVFSCRKNELKNNDSGIKKQEAFSYCKVPNEAAFAKQYPNGLPARVHNGEGLAVISTPMVIYISLKGETSTTPAFGGPYVAFNPGISGNDSAWIINKVKDDYSPFNVNITTDSNVYNAAPVIAKTKIIVGNGLSVYFGATGGTSLIGSAFFGTNEPCFVLYDQLGSIRATATAISHECGHTIGLYHQAIWATTSPCTLVTQYNPGSGAGTGLLSWGPIMGVPYNDSLTTWHVGPKPFANGQAFPNCADTQNDFQVLGDQLGLVADQDANVALGTHRSVGMNQSIEGVLNVTYSSITHTYTVGSDVDFIDLAANAQASGHMTITGPGNIDLRIVRYSCNQQMSGGSNDDAGSPNIAPVAYTNNCFVAIAATLNSTIYCPKTDMAGKWKLTITP